MSSASSAKVHQVIIIGAGISGLSAARYLTKNGISDIVILEATSKAGGRIQTEKFGNGLIELGAQWIHGEQNEFCQLVKAANHRHVKTSWEGKGEFLCPDGSKVDDAVVDEILGWIEDCIESVESSFTIETLQENPSAAKISMGEYLLEKFCRYLKEKYPDFEETFPEYKLRMALFQWGMSFQRIDNSCDKMNDVSLYRWSEFEVNPGEHYNNYLRGAQCLIDDVLVGEGQDSLHSKIIYNSPVKNINWGSGKTHVTVRTESEISYTASIVLVTVSVGVLKSNLESLFTPNIPTRLAEAIKSTGFGPVTKIFLEWSEPWWPQDLKGFQLVWPNEYLDCCEGSNGQEELWHKTITGFDPVLDNPNVLLAWLGGKEAVFAETISEESIKNRCVQILQSFTGYNVPPIENVIVSKWNANRFFQGAYSFRSVDGDAIDGDICATLNEPIHLTDEHGKNKPVILLAGEALSKTHYSTLHGAYESGIAQATKIVQYFSSKSVYPASKNVAKSTVHNEDCLCCQTKDVDKQTNIKSCKNETQAQISVLATNNDIQVPS